MERISVTASLNGVTLQLEEPAYRRLEAYFAEATRTLDGNPDRQEILADLEQAVADQCTRRMRPDQKIVTLAELEPALEQVGSVQVPGAADSADRAPRDTSRRLEQISEGAIISGVCQGLARYLQVDVTLLRLIALLLLFVSGGAMIVVYLILMLLLPFASAEPGSGPIGKLPLKSREFVGFVRGKLGAATG